MKRHFKYILMLCMAAGLFAACDERTPDLYSAPDGIYFNNRSKANVLLDSTDVTFVYEDDDVETMDVPVVVQTIGRQTDYDRPVSLRVYSEDAVEGVDYELISQPVIPAGTSAINYIVRLKRTDAIRTATKTVYLELAANDWFTTFLEQFATGEEAYPYADMLKYRITFSDAYTVAPVGWRPEYVGEFSERKLRLMWKLFDRVVDREDYNISGAIPFNRWVYMKNELDMYMSKQEAIIRGWETNEELDLDALVDPDAAEDERELLDFTPIVSNN